MSDGQIPADAGAVLARFESLGDSCEFGFVQRSYGIEPVSLLRWGGAPLPGLIDALRARFAGLYCRDDLLVIDGGMVVDRKYDLRFHAGAYTRDGRCGARALPDSESVRAMHAREMRHIAMLQRMTLDRLAGRSRVFVYKTNAGLTVEEILRLKTALDLYGPQRLFCVLPAGAQVAAGTVRAIATGVKIGGIARFAPYTQQENGDAAAWLSLCRSALDGAWGDEIVAPLAVPDEAQDNGGQAHMPAGAFEPTARGLEVHDKRLARALLTAIYETLLLRPPDLDGLEAHSRDLASGQSGVETLIEAFLESEEFAARLPAFVRRYVKRTV